MSRRHPCRPADASSHPICLPRPYRRHRLRHADGHDGVAYPPCSTIAVALDPDWLRYLNGFRAAAQLPSLREDSAWSAEGGLHSRYMVLSGDVGHSEDPDSPFYTNVGSAAGDTGNIAIGHI